MINPLNYQSETEDTEWIEYGRFNRKVALLDSFGWLCSVFWCFSPQLCVVSFSLFRGQVPAEAENNYLAVAKTLEMYGVDLHPVFVSSALFNQELFLSFILLSLIGYSDPIDSLFSLWIILAVYSINIDDELLVFLFISLLDVFREKSSRSISWAWHLSGSWFTKTKHKWGNISGRLMFKLNFSPIKGIIQPKLKTVSIISPACHSKPTWMCFRMLLNFQNKSFKYMINAMIYVILWYMI